MKLIRLLFFITSFLGISLLTFGQDEDSLYNAMLNQKVKVENPVYKPVIGIGYGVLNFYGEVHDNVRSPISGSVGYKLNIATFLDGKHMFKTNFYILMGSLTGNEHSLTADSAHNWNFKSDIFSIGINIHYDFGHLIKYTDKSFIRPFVSLGIENLQFNSKTDLLYKGADGQEYPYYYWNDGTIRDTWQNGSGNGNIIHRDYKYETDLRDLNRNGLGSYSQNTFAIPVEYGLDFRITDRVNLRIGDSWHYTFTDNIDDVSPSGTVRKGNKWNDMFRYTYFSLHFDLFSSPKEITLHKMAADVEGYDYTM
ncbi:MAG TPA: hypothetical protein VIH57_15850, partial [Bacteroidales bacterium]